MEQKSAQTIEGWNSLSFWSTGSTNLDFDSFYPLQSSHYYDANDPDYLRNYSIGALNWQVGDMHSTFPAVNPPQSTATNDFQFPLQSPRQKNPWDKEDVSHSSMDGFNQSLILNQTSSKMKTSTIPSPTGSTGSNYSRAPALTYRYPNGDTWSFYGTNGTLSGYGSNGNLLHTGYSLVDPRQVPVNPYYMYEYARGQAPKSAELFDPNAPVKSINEKQKSTRPFSHHSLEIDKNMNMHSFPRSPSHESFFARNLFYQGSKTGAPRSEGENLPSDQATDTHNSNTANMQHILEIYDFPQERSDMEFVLNEVKKSGATIKWLNDITVIAIYKTANSAKEALLKLPSHRLFMLRPWKLPVAQQGGNNGANQHTIE